MTAAFFSSGPKGCHRNSGSAMAITAEYPSTSASCAAQSRRPGRYSVAMPSAPSSAAAR